MKWRIYRLPGSRQWWHIDSGPGTFIINCLGFMSDVPLQTINGPGNEVPRAWVQVEGNLFVGPNGHARFMSETATQLSCGGRDNFVKEGIALPTQPEAIEKSIPVFPDKNAGLNSEDCGGNREVKCR